MLTTPPPPDDEPPTGATAGKKQGTARPPSKPRQKMVSRRTPPAGLTPSKPAKGGGPSAVQASPDTRKSSGRTVTRSMEKQPKKKDNDEGDGVNKTRRATTRCKAVAPSKTRAASGGQKQPKKIVTRSSTESAEPQSSSGTATSPAERALPPCTVVQDVFATATKRVGPVDGEKQDATQRDEEITRGGYGASEPVQDEAADEAVTHEIEVVSKDTASKAKGTQGEPFSTNASKRDSVAPATPSSSIVNKPSTRNAAKPPSATSAKKSPSSVPKSLSRRPANPPTASAAPPASRSVAKPASSSSAQNSGRAVVRVRVTQGKQKKTPPKVQVRFPVKEKQKLGAKGALKKQGASRLGVRDSGKSKTGNKQSGQRVQESRDDIRAVNGELAEEADGDTAEDNAEHAGAVDLDDAALAAEEHDEASVEEDVDYAPPVPSAAGDDEEDEEAQAGGEADEDVEIVRDDDPVDEHAHQKYASDDDDFQPFHPLLFKLPATRPSSPPLAVAPASKWSVWMMMREIRSRKEEQL